MTFSITVQVFCAVLLMDYCVSGQFCYHCRHIEVKTAGYRKEPMATTLERAQELNQDCVELNVEGNVENKSCSSFLCTRADARFELTKDEEKYELHYFERACLQTRAAASSEYTDSTSGAKCETLGKSSPNLRMNSVYEMLQYIGTEEHYKVTQEGSVCYCKDKSNCNGKDTHKVHQLLLLCTSYLVLCTMRW